MKAEDPAFPSDGSRYLHLGITARDYFAAKALQGYMAAPDVSDKDAMKVAKCCYRMADAMIAAGGKTHEF